MSYPVNRLAENSVIRKFRITAIPALESIKNTHDPKGEQATDNPKLTVQKQAKTATCKKGDTHE